MSRPLRIEFSGAWYHIMNRGRRRENIFEDNRDREMFLSLLRDAAGLWDVRVAGYCLMDNHYHMLVQTPQGNLSRFMRHVNGIYTQQFNRRHGYDGQLFRGRYKSILVAEDAHLLELIRYIHNNPLRAGLVDHAKEFKWSSHRGYLSAGKKWDWLHTQFILAMLAPQPGKQRAAYQRFMGEEEDEKMVALLDRKRWPGMLGGEDFISWVKQTFFEQKKDREIPESIRLAPDRDLIIREVCRVSGVEKEDVLRVRRGKVNDARDAAVYLCRVLRNDTLKELGIAFGMSGYGPAGSAVDRFRQRLRKDQGLSRRLQAIQDGILAKNIPK